MKRFILIFLVLAAGIQANEFVVKSFDAVPNDLAARRFERLDVNDDACAIIKVQTDIPKPFVFDANTGIEGDVDYRGDGEIWIWVSEGVRQLTIAKEGFIPLNYVIPQFVQSSNVYTLILVAKENKVPVVILTDPPDAERWIDGEFLGNDPNYEIEMGSRELMIKKKGFRTYRQTIEVNEDNKLFEDIKLQKVDIVSFKIGSEPAGARVFLDGQRVGETNYSDFRYPDTYIVMLELPGYVTRKDTIEILEEGSNEFNFVMEAGVTLDLSVYHEADAEKSLVRLDLKPREATLAVDGRLTSSRDFLLAPGKYSLEMAAQGFETMHKVIEISEPDTLNLTYDLIPRMGSLVVMVMPEKADVKLIQAHTGEVYQSWQGMKFLPEIPVGDYRVEASSPDYVSYSKRVLIEFEQRQEVKIHLQSFAGSINEQIQTIAFKRNLAMGGVLGLGALSAFLKAQSNASFADYEAAIDPGEIADFYSKTKTYNNWSAAVAGVGVAVLIPTVYFQININELKDRLR